MNIQDLNQLIPNEYRTLNVPETFMYYRSGEVFPITGEYISQNDDFIFKYIKNNGVMNIEQIKSSGLPNAIYTSEEWVQKYFTNLEVLALMRLEQNIILQNKNLGPKMQSSKQWLENMLFAAPSNNFNPAPYSYAEISQEAEQTLFQS
jgi:hypothetical protein